MTFARSTAVTAFALAALSACGKKDADAGLNDTIPDAAAAPAPPAVPRVSSMQLGRAVDSTRNITGGVVGTFGTRDTIYLAVRTDNVAANGNVAARWMTAAGKTIDSTAQQIAGSGTVTTEFHIMNAKEWPAGMYRVEVFLDNVSQGIKDFEIK